MRMTKVLKNSNLLQGTINSEKCSGTYKRFLFLLVLFFEKLMILKSFQNLKGVLRRVRLMEQCDAITLQVYRFTYRITKLCE